MLLVPHWEQNYIAAFNLEFTCVQGQITKVIVNIHQFHSVQLKFSRISHYLRLRTSLQSKYCLLTYILEVTCRP